MALSATRANFAQGGQPLAEKMIIRFLSKSSLLTTPFSTCDIIILQVKSNRMELHHRSSVYQTDALTNLATVRYFSLSSSMASFETRSP